MLWDVNSFMWHQPCKYQTVLQLHHLGGYSKCAVQSHSHSFRVACNQSAVSLPQSREWHYSKAIDILSCNVWKVVLLNAGCMPHLAKTFSQNVKVELVAHHQLCPCTFLCTCTKVWIHYMLNYFLFLSICSLTILLSFFSSSSKNQPRVWKQLTLIFFEWFLLELKTRFEWMLYRMILCLTDKCNL